MRVLAVHNYYQQSGGEDRVFQDETTLLETRGHLAGRFTVHNDVVHGMNRLSLLQATLWNRETYHRLRRQIRDLQPDIVHFHNILPLISPSAYYAAKREGATVVQTLHNYRLMCPMSLFYRAGRPCEDCLGRAFAAPGVKYACYRDSHSASAVVAGMLTAHRILGTWEKQIDRYIAVSSFTRDKHIEGRAVAPEKMSVKPHFVHPAPSPGEGQDRAATYVGRLSAEKGVRTLLDAWEKLDTDIHLRIIGDGPLADIVQAAARRLPRVEWLQRRTPEEVTRVLGRSRLAIVPSECYESFGRVAAEAYAVGTPVVAADIGALPEIVDHGKTGWLFTPRDPEDLADKVRHAFADSAHLLSMRENARAAFEEKYTASRNYGLLMSIYEQALSNT